MAVDTKRLPVESLAHVVARLAAGLELVPALELLAVAAVEATGADVGVVRVVDPVDGALVARAVAPAESALAAGLVGSRSPAASPERDGGASEPFSGVVVATANLAGHVVGAVELLRTHEAFDAEDEALADLAAAHLALALRTTAPDTAPGGS